MLNLGEVPAAVRSVIWSSLASLMRRIDRREAAVIFEARASWNNDLILWWDGCGPLPESPHSSLIAYLDLASVVALVGGITVLAVYAKE